MKSNEINSQLFRGPMTTKSQPIQLSNIQIKLSYGSKNDLCNLKQLSLSTYSFLFTSLTFQAALSKILRWSRGMPAKSVKLVNGVAPTPSSPYLFITVSYFILFQCLIIVANQSQNCIVVLLYLLEVICQSVRYFFIQAKILSGDSGLLCPNASYSRVILLVCANNQGVIHLWHTYNHILYFHSSV